MRICLLPHEKRKISFGMRPGRRPCREALLTWRQIPANPLEPLPKRLTANPTAVRCAVVAVPPFELRGSRQAAPPFGGAARLTEKAIHDRCLPVYIPHGCVIKPALSVMADPFR